MKLRNLMTLTLLLALASTATATIDWAGAIWPNSGTSHPDNADINVYVRLQKAGVTEFPGQGAGLSATLYYKSLTDTEFTSVVAGFQGDAGSDDEYFAPIPMAALDEELVYYYYEAYDSTDATLYTGIPDQNNVVLSSESPGELTIIPATSVTFIYNVCVNMSCEEGVVGAGISGSFNDWSFQALSDDDLDQIWCGTVIIPAGSPPHFEFKFRNGIDGNAAWEAVANRPYDIPDGATGDSETFWWDNFDCGGTLQSVLVMFQVDMNCYEDVLHVSVQGDTPPFDWTAGSNPLSDADLDGIWDTELTIEWPEGEDYTAGYKFNYSTLPEPTGDDWNWELDWDSRPLLITDGTVGPVELPVVLFDDWDCAFTSVEITVTFQIDMNCLDASAYAGGVSIQGGAAPLPFWSPGELLLEDPEVDGVFETTVIFPVGTATTVEYKHALSPNGMDWYWEDSIGNRVLMLDDGTPSVVLDPVLWDDWFCPPAVSIAVTATEVQITWDAVPTALNYQVHGSTDPYFTPDVGNLLGTTTATSWIEPLAAGNLFYKVIAVN
ncbi:hypothetical protein H8D51_01150 [bacterium]|nr:hypothetical protein [bacterium]